jgi:hypothetical protein
MARQALGERAGELPLNPIGGWIARIRAQGRDVDLNVAEPDAGLRQKMSYSRRM